MSEDNYQESIKRIDENILQIRNELKQTRKDFAKIIAEMKEENRQRQILLEKENIKRDANTDNIESVFSVSIDALDKKCDWLVNIMSLIFGSMGFFIAMIEFFRR